MTPEETSVARHIKALAGLICLGIALISSNCTRIPTDYPRTPSTALKQPVSTGISGIFEREAAQHPGKSGFAVIPDNQAAFTERVALADFAEKTLDVQYYIWSADTIGRMLGERIIKAAERGVRVRFLLDDHSFKKRDSAVASLAAHPNIEIRIFNPYKYRSTRVFELAFNFNRLNKRMHNKVMIMDNSAVIVGGRNIADEYFGLSEKYNNRDLDIAAVGPIVRELSKTFDEFWNSPGSIPIEALIKETPNLEDFHRQVAVLREQIKTGVYPYPLDADLATLRKRLMAMNNRLIWAKGEVIYDSFDSMVEERTEETVSHQLFRHLEKARKEIAIESAYFVTRDQGVEFVRQVVGKGVKVRTLTNSLASNNVIAAQAGHNKRRKKLIEAGMDIYEFRPDAAVVYADIAPQGKESITTLHTKTLVIDDKKAFVGSFNLDPRSAEINSEIALLVHSPEFTREVRAYLDEGIRPENAYQLKLDARGHLQWQATVDGSKKVWTKDPETSAFKRMKAGMIGVLPIEDQL